jgi:hypothetical protein
MASPGQYSAVFFCVHCIDNAVQFLKKQRLFDRPPVTQLVMDFYCFPFLLTVKNTKKTKHNEFKPTLLSKSAHIELTPPPPKTFYPTITFPGGKFTMAAGDDVSDVQIQSLVFSNLRHS